MSETIKWNLYTATEAEIQALWRLVEQALESSDVVEAVLPETQVA